jgi:hypothetical protein
MWLSLMLPMFPVLLALVSAHHLSSRAQYRRARSLDTHAHFLDRHQLNAAPGYPTT